MKRTELGALLAQTPPAMASTSRHGIPATSNIQRPQSSPLSPRQHFQSQIRSLHGISPPRNGASKTPWPPAGNPELQHISSIRVQPQHVHISRPVQEPLQTLDGSIHAPDFIVEEREAWGRSPKSAYQTPTNETPASSTDPAPFVESSLVLGPPEETPRPLSEPRKQRNEEPPLRLFEPTRTDTNSHERPKTSRGPKHGLEGHFTIHQDAQDAEHGTSNDADTAHSAQRSKFLEGSMSQRSAALASTWDAQSWSSGYDDNNTDVDDDATPQPSRSSRPSSSIDGEDNTPISITPNKPKRGFFRSRGQSKPKDDPLTPKRGLKKSFSTWNFHQLGEKVRMFGGSAIDQKSKAADNNRDGTDSSVPTDHPLQVLDARKRKAQEAYSVQFGWKRRKSDIGSPSKEDSQQPAAPASSLRSRRSVSSHGITPNTGSHRQRVSSGPDAGAARGDQRNETDLRKKPSRKDLIKENQQLRQLLRESQSSLFATPVSSHLLQNLARHEMSPAVSVVPDDDTPPVPSLTEWNLSSERQILGHMGNATNPRHTQSSLSPRAEEKGSMKGRPVSAIFEENEDETINDQSVNRKHAVGNEGEQWQWPDDVF